MKSITLNLDKSVPYHLTTYRVISYIHDSTAIMGKPIMVSTIINVIVHSGRNSLGITISHTCIRTNAKPA